MYKKVEKKKISWADFGLSVAAASLMVLLPRFILPCGYPMADDKTMIRVLSGCTSGVPDGHAIFMQYPLTWLIARLYGLCRGIDWYLAVMLLVYVVTAAAVLYRLLRRLPSRRMLILPGFVLAFYGLWLGRLCSLTFTTVGAFAAAGLLLVYALQPKELDNRPANLALALLLFCFTYTVRIVFCGMALPFLGLIWLWKYGGNLRSRSCWAVPLCAALCAGCMFGMNRLAYSTPEWQSFLAYNDERSYLEDFGNFPDYEEHQDFITSLGLTKEEYHAVRSMDYTLVGSYSPEKAHQLYDYALALEEGQPVPQKLKKTLVRTVKFYFNAKGTEHWQLLTMVSILLPALLLAGAAAAAAQKRALSPLLLPLLNLSCEALLWLYIGYCNRGPLRVLISLRLVTASAALVGLYLLAAEWPAAFPRLSKRGKRGCSLVLAVLLCLSAAGQFGAAQEKAKDIVPTGSSPLCDYVEAYPDHIYIIDTPSAKHIKAVQVPANLIYSGGWVVYSPLYQQKLESCGLTEVNRNTLLRENVCLVLNVKNRTLNAVLGLSPETQVEYTVAERFGDIEVCQIHSIAGLEG